eukprot:scaffold134149_cov15-Tisochrysis_lutea.AAC.1
MSSEKLPCSSASEPSASPSLDRAAFRPAPDVAAPVVGAGRRRRSWLCQGVPDGGAVGALSVVWSSGRCFGLPHPSSPPSEGMDRMPAPEVCTWWGGGLEGRLGLVGGVPRPCSAACRQ